MGVIIFKCKSRKVHHQPIVECSSYQIQPCQLERSFAICHGHIQLVDTIIQYMLYWCLCLLLFSLKKLSRLIICNWTMMHVGILVKISNCISNKGISKHGLRVDSCVRTDPRRHQRRIGKKNAQLFKYVTSNK